LINIKATVLPGHLDNAVWYARHAMSIDENRADFARVFWGGTQNATQIGRIKSGLRAFTPILAGEAARNYRRLRRADQILEG
jgi:Uncharacterized alpha/beta hydrolase domain (DUF2235)